MPSSSMLDNQFVDFVSIIAFHCKISFLTQLLDFSFLDANNAVKKNQDSLIM